MNDECGALIGPEGESCGVLRPCPEHQRRIYELRELGMLSEDQARELCGSPPQGKGETDG